MTDRKPLRLTIACLLALVVGAGIGIGVGTRWDDRTAGPGYQPRMNSPLLGYALCGEEREPDPGVPVSVVQYSTGFGTPIRNRRVELQAQRHPQFGWIVWAQLVESTSELDRLWLDWSYERDPEHDSLWRDCAQPSTAGRATPAIHVFDDLGRTRWFRACGQVPPPDRGARLSGTFCTDWGRPL